MTKVCCNCRHCIRVHDGIHLSSVSCYCEVYRTYLTYADVFELKCKHWAKEVKK